MSRYLCLESQALLMPHIAVVEMQISLQRSSGLLLCTPCILRVAVVESIAVVPAVAVRLPRAQTHPAEFRSACLIAAGHVIAASVFLDRRLE